MSPTSPSQRQHTGLGKVNRSPPTHQLLSVNQYILIPCESECLQCVSTHLADLERLGCTLDQGREYCVGQLYRCVNSGGSLQCVVDGTGSGLPLEQCEAVCGVDETEWR